MRAEIHLGNIRRNAEKFSAAAGVKLCAVVKADAYGHGAEEVVAALSETADCFAVALIEEGLAIRTAAQGKEILVFTPPTTEEEGFVLASNGFIATVPDLATAKLLKKVCKRFDLSANAHIKVNTGMNRYGGELSEVQAICRFLQGDRQVRVTGIYSHLYACDGKIAEEQRARFSEAERVCKACFPNATAHLSATFGATLGKAFAFDMVRIGIGLYGYLPVKTDGFVLEKGMTVYAKTVSKGRYLYGGVGYGAASGKLKKGEALGVLRLGYADGFLRKRENGTEGWEKNANALCMDVCIRVGETEKGAWVPVMTDADETAERTGTISYEVLCAATRRAEFVYEER